MIDKKSNITLAVLPFLVDSNEDRIKNLFVGFVDDLITNFSKFIGLSVISSFSTNQIKDISNQQEIDKLLANYLVIGKVRHLKENLRISIQLVKTEDKSLVFAGQHDETLDSLLEAQDSIVQQIVAVLQERIDFNLLSHSYRKNAVELAAYENYLLGMHTLMKGSGDNDKKARSFFNAAISIDPNFSLAYTGLSLSYFNFWSCLLWDRWDESMKGAHKFALKAIELDPNDYTALAVLGRTYVYKGEYEQAEHCLRKSLRMNPNDATNLLRVSFSLLFLGYAREAVNLYLRAIEINPFHKDQYFAYGANCYLETGEFEKSIALAKKVPFNCWTDFPAWVAAAYLQLGDFENVERCWKVYLEQFKIEAYTGKGDMEIEAIEWLPKLNPFKGENYLIPLCDYFSAKKNLPNTAVKTAVPKKRPSLLFNGDIWEMNFNNSSVLLKDAKGYHDIHKLLSNPFQEFYCMDLMGAVVNAGSAGEVIDDKAKAIYLNKLKELRADIQEAEQMNQLARLSKLTEQHDSLLNHLSDAVGLGGKTRKLGATAEKARSAVTWRIRSALKKIENAHPELGSHLSKSIKTGTYCSYKPEIKIDWIL